MKQKLSKQYMKRLKNNFTDLDVIDVEAEWDSSKSEDENFIHLTENYRDFLKEKVKDRIGFEEAKAQVEKEEYEKEQEIIKQEKELIEKREKEYQDKLKEIKLNPTPNIDKITKVIEDFILLTLNEKTDKHSLIICGKAGIGKTFLIKKILRKMFSPEQLTKIIKNGHISPLAYYNLIYDNPTGTFFFDDVSGLHSDTGIALMKQTTETEKKRFVCYSSTTGKLEGRLPYCFFDGKQIFALNNISNSKTLQPIISRVRNIEFNPTYKEILVMMYEIIKYKWLNINLDDKIKIVEYLERNSNEVSENFDLRLLNDVMDIYIYSNGINEQFKEMVAKIIEINKDKELILDLIKSNLSVKEQVKEFTGRRNKSRATYFRMKESLKVS